MPGLGCFHRHINCIRHRGNGAERPEEPGRGACRGVHSCGIGRCLPLGSAHGSNGQAAGPCAGPALRRSGICGVHLGDHGRLLPGTCRRHDAHRSGERGSRLESIRGSGSEHARATRPGRVHRRAGWHSGGHRRSPSGDARWPHRHAGRHRRSCRRLRCRGDSAPGGRRGDSRGAPSRAADTCSGRRETGGGGRRTRPVRPAARHFRDLPSSGCRRRRCRHGVQPGGDGGPHGDHFPLYEGHAPRPGGHLRRVLRAHHRDVCILPDLRAGSSTGGAGAR